MSMAMRSSGSNSQWTAADQVLQGRAIHELHGDEGAAFLLADVVDRADVGMIERRGGPSFAAKTLQGLRITGHVIGKKLEGDETAQARVLGLVHHAHPAAAKLFQDAVVRDSLADHIPGEVEVDS